jgi:hypothetical protein
MVSAFPSSNSEFTDENIEKFDTHWVEFLKHQYGCPLEKGTVVWSNCNPKIGRTNYEEFNKARNMAKKIFNLVEPPETK